MEHAPVIPFMRSETKLVEAVDMVKYGTAPLDVMNVLKLTATEQRTFLQRVELARNLNVL